MSTYTLRALRSIAALASVALAAACGPSSLVDDAATPEGDGGGTLQVERRSPAGPFAEYDAGTSNEQDAASATDAASPEDTGTAVDVSIHDAGAPVDSGSTPHDSGTVVDAGTVAHDSGTPVGSGHDSGTVVVDAGVVDSGSSGGGTDAGVVDSGPPPGTAPPYLAPLDAATQSHIRALLALGTSLGHHPNVFAKIGDSITESGSFLSDIGHGWYDLGSYTSLQGTVTNFSAFTFADGTNSFDRASTAAMGGWTTADALGTPGSSPVVNELNVTLPAFAVIMLGTNDLDHWGVDTYIANMQSIVNDCETAGVVPIVSTIPDRMDASSKDALVLQFNAALHTFVASNHIPLIEYWSAMQPLPNHGVSTDGIHPNIFIGPDASSDGGYFTAPALQFGYNVRNLTAVQAIDYLRRTFP